MKCPLCHGTAGTDFPYWFRLQWCTTKRHFDSKARPFAIECIEENGVPAENPAEALRSAVGVSAGSIAPSSNQYTVTETHAHTTLECGDVVVMTLSPSPRSDNLLLRLRDMTLHALSDENDQYVHLTQAK